jgi:hypothetical protein
MVFPTTAASLRWLMAPERAACSSNPKDLS